ncbi:sensor histidine kinase [Fundidesulfovibrio putealis]|uniref:sensor histidine kinase n=1 Tax=Fundidesulfovibrio putealis TaxID=270496 RepID=UPI00042513FF|nr:MASE3 domain-containing protein [Fundidesulfovibrio putealis]
MKSLLRSVDWKEASLGIVLLVALVMSASYSYLFFHTFAELFSIVIAFGVFMLAWNTQRFMNNGYLLFMGIAYFFVAILDLLHTLAYKGMPIFPGYDDNNLPPQIWIVARYMESLALLAAPLFFRRKLPVVPVFCGFCAVTILALLSIFSWRVFPDCFVAGYGLTPFKIASEYIICAILTGATWLLWINRDKFDPLVLRFLILSMAATIATELCFTAYTNLYATINLVGHIFKILSFYFMYRAIIETGLKKPYDLLFRDLQMEIEERRKAQAALLESRELLDKTQKAGGIGGFDWERESNELHWTDETHRLFEAPEGFVPTMDAMLERVDPENRISLMVSFDSSRETGIPLDVEAKIATFQGNERWIRFLGGVTLHGTRKTLAGVLQDVTDKRRLEQLREDIDRMSRHDLKSPLNAIIGLPRLILLDKDMPREEIDEYLRLIRQTGYNMLNLINISLEMFKMEQGTYTFEPSPVDIVELLRKLKLEAAGKLKTKELTLETTIEGQTAGETDTFPVLSEELPCWSMLGNLLENAIQASPKGHAVTIALARQGGQGRISITNKGAVPHDIRARFFEKYATSGKTHGTGLGTYSARLIAQTLGGSIALDTSDPDGTTVHVTLPLAE